MPLLTIYGSTEWHYNADLSGDVRIVRKDGSELSVRGSDMLEFMCAYIDTQKHRLEEDDEDPVAT